MRIRPRCMYLETCRTRPACLDQCRRVIMKKKGGRSMTIQITSPEVEALINERLQGGGFKDAEDVILQALQASPPKPAGMPQPDAPPAKNIEELFAPLQ